MSKLIQVLHSVLQPSIASAVTKRLAAIEELPSTSSDVGPSSAKRSRIWETGEVSPSSKLEALHQELRLAAPLQRGGGTMLPPTKRGGVCGGSLPTTSTLTGSLVPSSLTCPAALASVGGTRSESNLHAAAKRAAAAAVSSAAVWERLAASRVSEAELRSRASEAGPSTSAAATGGASVVPGGGGLMLPLVPCAAEFSSFLTDIEANLGNLQRQALRAQAAGRWAFDGAADLGPVRTDGLVQ